VQERLGVKKTQNPDDAVDNPAPAAQEQTPAQQDSAPNNPPVPAPVSSEPVQK
jgi:phospholipid-binding lipoprotein MlaA